MDCLVKGCRIYWECFVGHSGGLQDDKFWCSFLIAVPDAGWFFADFVPCEGTSLAVRCAYSVCDATNVCLDDIRYYLQSLK